MLETTSFDTSSTCLVMSVSSPKVERLEVSAYTVPTETPEADGTLAWRETTPRTRARFRLRRRGMGYSFADIATANLIDDHLKREVIGQSALHIPENWIRMVRAIRNLGRPGICSMAIAAVDNALWDLKARLLGLCVADLLGRAHISIPAYGSGGFTSYSDDQLGASAGGLDCAGPDQREDENRQRTPFGPIGRVRVARDAIGPTAELFVDANGAYGRKDALAKASEFAEFGVSWFEEPVSSDDLDGLRLIRETCAARNAHCRRRVWLRFVLFPPHAGGACRGRAAGRRHPMRGGHRVSAAGNLCGCILSAVFGAYRAVPACARCLRDSVRDECRVLFRSLQDRKMFFDGALVPSAGMLRPDSRGRASASNASWPIWRSTKSMATLLHESQIAWARPHVD